MGSLQQAFARCDGRGSMCWRAPGLAALAAVGGAGAGGRSWEPARPGGSTSAAGGVEANKPSERARISHDGKHVCYQTNASNLAAGDPALPDVYWSDLTDPAHPVTKRVSIGWDGSNANDQSTFCEISGDGRYVVFSSHRHQPREGQHRSGAPSSATCSSPTCRRPPATSPPTPTGRSCPTTAATSATTPSPRSTTCGSRTCRRAARCSSRPTPRPGTDVESLRPEISGDGTHVVFASDLGLVANGHERHPRRLPRRSAAVAAPAATAGAHRARVGRPQRPGRRRLEQPARASTPPARS